MGLRANAAPVANSAAEKLSSAPIFVSFSSRPAGNAAVRKEQRDGESDPGHRAEHRQIAPCHASRPMKARENRKRRRRENADRLGKLRPRYSKLSWSSEGHEGGDSLRDSPGRDHISVGKERLPPFLITHRCATMRCGANRWTTWNNRSVGTRPPELPSRSFPTARASRVGFTRVARSQVDPQLK